MNRKSGERANAVRFSARQSLSDSDVALVLSTPKTLVGNAAWELVPGRFPEWRLSADVLIHGEDESCRISGRAGKTNWSWALLFRATAIRRTGLHGGEHTNPDGSRIAVPHKHTWDETHGDGFAYIPNDIDFTSVNRAFFGFLSECKIAFGGVYQMLEELS